MMQGVRRKIFIFIRAGFPVTFRAGWHSYVRSLDCAGMAHPEACVDPSSRSVSAPTPNEVKMKNLNALLLTAALSGLIGGTTVAASAATHTSNGATVKAAKAG